MSKDFMRTMLERIHEKDFAILSAKYENPKTKKEEEIFSDMSVSFNDSNITIIYGENASGKSFLSKIIQSVCRYNEEKRIPVRAVSVSNRTSSGIEKAMIFGDESEQSTGETSFRVAKLGLNSFKNDEGQSILIMDEPDIGMSRKYSKAFGKYIIEEINDTNPKEKSVIIVSHNIDFIKSILLNYGKPVNYIGVNTKMSLNEWIDDETEYDVLDLELLKSIGIEKWRGISRAINDAKKNKSKTI